MIPIAALTLTLAAIGLLTWLLSISSGRSKNNMKHFTFIEVFAILWKFKVVDATEFLNRARATGNEDIFSANFGPYYWVCLNNPDLIRDALSHKHLQSRTVIHKMLKTTLGEGILTTDGKIWRKGRRVTGNCFVSVPISSLLPIFNEEAGLMVQILQRQVGHEFGISDYLFNVTVSCILRAAFDIDLDVQRTSHPVIGSVNACMDLTYDRIQNLLLHIDFIYNLTPSGALYRKALQDAKKFISEVVQEKVEGKHAVGNGEDPKENKFIYNFFARQELSENEIIDHSLTIFAAGYETVTSALGYTICCLGQNPEMQERIFREDKALRQKLNGRAMNSRDLEEYEYLERIIKEVLRLFPPAGMVSQLATCDAEIGPYVIPRGAMVTVSLRDLHRHPKHFPYPHEFNPDNFLPENVAKRHKYAYLPFNAGPRACIGSLYAMALLKILTVFIVREFTIHCNGTVDTLQANIKHGFSNRISENYPVRLERRS